MYLFPTIDLRGGQVVRLAQGDYDRQTAYPVDPVAQARQFAQAGATWVHVVDLDGARSGTMAHLEVIGDICAVGQLKVEVGGGVRSQAVIDQLLAAGVDRVVLGTAAVEDWPWFERLIEQRQYHGRIVLGLDARGGRLAVSGWRRQTDALAVEVAASVTDRPLGAIVYTDIDTDGLMAGPNVEATRAMAEATSVPVVASGGVGSLEHLRTLRQLPIQGAIVGRAIYEDVFTVAQAVRVFEQGGDAGSSGSDWGV